MNKHKRVARICGSCHGKFMARADNVKRGGGRYCSQACMWRVHANRAQFFGKKKPLILEEVF